MASIIPDKPLFIVTSALNTGMGVIGAEERMQQTIRGLETLRKNVSDAIVILADGSPNKVEEEKFKVLSNYVDFIADFSTDADVGSFAKNHRKSEAENVLLLKCMLLLKQEPMMMKMMHSVNRIFKFSGRTDLHDTFDINDHNHFGKYVFKKRMPTWIQGEKAEIFTDLLITRFFSICPSLIDHYITVCQRNIGVIIDAGVDTEHAHFFNIDSEYLIELDTIHCQGIMAGTGLTEVY